MARLVANGLNRSYPPSSLLARLRGEPPVHAVRDIDLVLHEGQRLGIVGESGSGKSTLMRLLLGLESPDSGTVTFDGRPVQAGGDLAWYRRLVQFVPQDPSSSLNPHRRVRDSIAEPLQCLKIGGDHAARVDACLEAVGLSPDLAGRFPGELSGGQRQRVAIARAIAPEPAVIVADEAVSALDALVRLNVMTTLRDICAQQSMSLVFVSHDLGAVCYLCDTVAVLSQGRIVETGHIPQVFEAPASDETRALVTAVPMQPDVAAC
ncbi:MAG: dipeptide/oligopeptide/nickel ABC transporter ATP-binding protein [Propionibacteriaceae bacterium]|nr:dipeptide/oligopeptide/nickel ABC transporter ATP-binding protein [Propionibacteriaceae bacterium]